MVQKIKENRSATGVQHEEKLGIFRRMKENIEAIREKDPAANNLNAFTIMLTSPGLQALTMHRFNHILYAKGWYNTARIASQATRFFTGVEIHPGATIGRRVVIDHGMGIVIGETAIVGNDVLIFQGATLGGTGHDVGKKRHPTIEDNVVIGTHAKVLGSITVGRNSKVGAGAIVMDDVPADSTAVNMKSRIVKMNGNKIDPLDHAKVEEMAGTMNNLGDEIESLKARIAELEKLLPKPPSE